MVRLEAEVETRDATRDATNISNYVSGDSDKMFPLEKNINSYIGAEWIELAGT